MLSLGPGRLGLLTCKSLTGPLQSRGCVLCEGMPCTAATGCGAAGCTRLPGKNGTVSDSEAFGGRRSGCHAQRERGSPGPLGQ